MLSRLTLKNVWPLPLLPFPGTLRRALASLLPPCSAEGAKALVLDARLLRPLRALGYAVVARKTDVALSPLETRMSLISATAPMHAVLETLQSYAQQVVDGGVIVLRCTASERLLISAAFLHAGLLNIQQVRIGRSFLTTGTVPLYS